MIPLVAKAVSQLLGPGKCRQCTRLLPLAGELRRRLAAGFCFCRGLERQASLLPALSAAAPGPGRRFPVGLPFRQGPPGAAHGGLAQMAPLPGSGAVSGAVSGAAAGGVAALLSWPGGTEPGGRNEKGRR